MTARECTKQSIAIEGEQTNNQEDQQRLLLADNWEEHGQCDAHRKEQKAKYQSSQGQEHDSKGNDPERCEHPLYLTLIQDTKM